MHKYIWSWSDEDGVYTNCDDSLEEILSAVLSCYFEHALISTNENIYSIAISDDEVDFQQFQISQDPADIASFLENIASSLGRPDKFDIQQIATDL